MIGRIENWLRNLFSTGPGPAGAERAPISGTDLPTDAPFDRYRLLAALLPALEAKGFVLSPDRLIRLQHLLTILPPEAPAADLGDYLCPAFASSEQQQEQFHEVFAGIAVVFAKKETAPEEIDLKEKPKPPQPSPPPVPEPPVSEPSAPAPTHTLPPPPSENPTDTGAPAAKPPLTLDLEQCIEPPFTWNIAPDEHIPVAAEAGFSRTLTRLRSRERTDTRSIDWPATTRASVRQAGVPAIRYKHHTRPIEYLMLVERFAAEDHRALLFDRLWRTLREQEVLVERFFHDGDLRSCHNEQFPQGISLRDLRHRYASARLLVLGSGHRFLSTKTGKPAEWTAALPDWPSRALLTPVSKQQWGLRERRLADLFTLLPAAWESVRYLAEGPETDPHARFADLPADVRAVADWSPISLETPLARSLRRYFEPELCTWIAACAVWPALHFDLTLRLGRLLSTPENKLLTYDKLTRMARLDWFANGHIPRAARAELLEFLDARHPELLQRVSAYLLDLLEQHPPENPRSVAFAEHQINIAILRVMATETPDPELVRHLRTVLKRLDRQADLTDFVLPASVETMLDKLGWEEKAPPPPPPTQPTVPVEEQTQAFVAGQAFGQFKLIEMVGRGGMADVWKAEYLESNRLGALKIYRRTDALGEKLAMYEYEMTRNLRHPNINQVLNIGVANKALYLVFWYRETSAYHLIGKATEADLWKIIHDIGSALAYMHGLNPPVLHNDLKPGHFLLDEEGRYVLSDFGLAEEVGEGAERNFHADSDLLRWLRQKTILLEYPRPPEHRSSFSESPMEETAQYQFESFSDERDAATKTSSGKTDIWMLGTCLYQIMTGEMLKNEQVRQSRSMSIDIHLLPRGFSDRLWYAIAECLRWNPEHRPSANQLVREAQWNLYPESKPKKIKELEDKIATIKEQKNKAVKDKQYEDAANLRDQESKLVRQLEFAKLEWEEQNKHTPTVEVKAPPAESESTQPTPEPTEIPLPDLVFVKGGTFQMGEKGVAEPVHKVTLSDFEIGRTAVTNAQYCAFLNEKGNQTEGGVEWINLQGNFSEEKCRIQSADGSRFTVETGYENHPVIYISWFGAEAYCRWLSEKSDKNYRLPTEAEWEYAASGGSQSNKYEYAGSDEPDEVAWYSSNSSAKAHPVAEKKANELGVHDMSGNVWEWCQDWYGDYSPDSQTNPTGPTLDSYRVYRGGSWFGDAQRCRVSYRDYYTPNARASRLGFRVASSVQSEDMPAGHQVRTRPVMK